MNSISLSLVSLLALGSLTAFADIPIGPIGPIGPIRIQTRDLVPVSVKITSLGHGEFPQLSGAVVVRNIGNAAVKYVGPQTCQDNPFGGAPSCFDVTTLKINDVYAWIYDTLVTVQPGEVKELPFTAITTDTSLVHCGNATVSFDVEHKFNQASPIGNVFANDTASVRTFYAWENTLCRIPIIFPIPVGG